MSIAQPERVIQNRVIKLFEDELGYSYLGDWQHRETNSNIEEKQLFMYLTRQGYNQQQISTAIHQLRNQISNRNRDLYGNNKAVYELLRYGVNVQTEAGKNAETIKLINWQQPENNDFYIAEEVTLKGQHNRRPDIVLYINGIAVAVLELKNSRTSVGDGIRQLISNQKPMFHQDFFSTVQLVFAGNDSEGLRYGTVGTPEKYFLTWKEDEDDDSRIKLDKYLLKLCHKTRFLELLYDFVLFDAGVKKVPRVHQYFAIKVAQEHVKQRKGGIIWHTQGSGKSITMVFLAKWILENNPNARVAVVTDRDELDKQIEAVFSDSGEKIHRSSSGRDLMLQLGKATPRLLCSLVHKFGKRDVDNFERYIRELEAMPSQSIGDLFVFVDECHRTHSGRLHRGMKAILQNAVLIGFTGTPLLKKDKQTSLEVFGGYIHTYKFSEAVADEVILDLMYEARDINQRLGSQERIDAWFAAKTKHLNTWKKEALKTKWGTIQNVLSSTSRIDQVVNDIVFDFETRPRLSDGRGTAILVASSIYEACCYYKRFQSTPFKGKCAVITSYNPQPSDISREDTGANSETDKEFIYRTYKQLLEQVDRKGKSKTEEYEDWAKECFKNQPADMKLLIVVDKLLTGFDAPSCTYLYIDKSMQDHGLFQAICRTNRLDGDDKLYGYIVDYKDLFKKVEKAIAVYSSELDQSMGGADPMVLMHERLSKGKERLDTAMESYRMLLEPVALPRDEHAHIRYFCGNTERPDELEAHKPKRETFYKAVVSLLRAYANIADELDVAGYSSSEIEDIQALQKEAVKLLEAIRLASGEYLDLKAYEADMRYLIDTYIQADEPRKISPFDNMPLLTLIEKLGIEETINNMPPNVRRNRQSVAETIENNVRRKITQEKLNDPAFYAEMSKLLDDIIDARNKRALEYEAYLSKIAELAHKIQAGSSDGMLVSLKTPGQRALYNNLGENEALALAIDEKVKTIRSDDWRGTQAKERVIKRGLYNILQDEVEVERIFVIIRQQPEY